MSRGTALGRVTECLKDHHVDTTKKLKKAPKEWQELVICDRESHEREGEARIIQGGLEDVGIGELADFRCKPRLNSTQYPKTKGVKFSVKRCAIRK